MKEWAFKDFIDARGENVIRRWLDQQPQQARNKIQRRIAYLETITMFPEQWVSALSGPCQGLIELRLDGPNKVRYRPIGYYGPARREITLLIGAVEKGNDFVPREACEIARARKHLVQTEEGHTRDHEF